VSDADVLAGTCTGCHGYRGASAASGLPSIGGLDRRFFLQVMKEFRSGDRPSTIMGRLAKGYDDAQLDTLARYYADQPWASAGAAGDPARTEEGRRLHAEACEDCHEEEGRYQDLEVPRIAGQQPDYLYFQLRAQRDPKEGMPQPNRMRRAVAPLTDGELRALSEFYASRGN
jgi:sulfide dehydrogenase cytochrome subunit